jgi:Rieske Fe-S protein
MNVTVSRRSTVVGAAAVVVGAVVGFVYGRNSDATKSRSQSGYAYASGPAGGKPVVALTAVPDGGGLIKSGLVLVREGARVHAFSSTCTHLGCTVNRVAGGKIYCPCHGSVFDAQTGAVRQGPATRPLTTVAVRVRNGEVYAP